MAKGAEKKAAHGATWKIGKLFLILAAAVVCVAVFMMKDKGSFSGDAGADGALVIPVAKVTNRASFFPVNVKGTTMEVIAVRDGGGNIRTAFNACQVCYDSGKGYYKQSGDVLVCQNCGNRFSRDQVGLESGGCNPWPILAEDRTVSGDAIVISRDFLEKSQKIFANWKSGR